MLFNSLGFLFAFLPVTLLLYYGVAARRGALRRPFLALVTLLFYAIGGPKSVPLLLVSVLVNYGAGRVIARPGASPKMARVALVLGIGFDLALLIYFKYMNFFIGNANGLLGAHIALLHIALPLGISFFTFQQIGFLIDLSRGRFALGRAIDYFSFVLFFPQLLAGPISRYDEIDPQLAAPPRRGLAMSNILIGLAIFALGLFKKTVIADGIGSVAAPVFESAAAGHLPGFVDGWFAAFAYTAQIYFDFAGYSDMAIGVARMFSIILPLNFHSPLRASSIIDIWRRWHVTLSRWVTSYIFQPLSVPMARLAADRAPGRWGSFLLSFALPTMLSMIVIGIWHGAGWTFVLFGVLQGSYMIVNEYWRQARRKARKAKGGSSAPAPAWAYALTLVAFVVSVVLFRAPDLATAGRVYAGMIGFGAGWADDAVAAKWQWGVAGGALALLLTYGIVYLAPNTQQFMARVDPVLEWASKWSRIDPPRIRIEWRPTPWWTAFTALVLFVGLVLMMGGTTNFIYFNF